jgi:hypothetical protein
MAPHFEHTLPTCGICGCDEVETDYVIDDSLQATAYALELSECPRCDNRWTRPLRVPTRAEVRSAAAVRVLQQPAHTIPNAA